MDFTLQMPEHGQPCAGALLRGCQPPELGRAWHRVCPPGHRVPSCLPGQEQSCDSGTEPFVCSPAGTSLGTRLLDVLSTEMPGPGHCRLVPGKQMPCCSARLICSAVCTSGPLGTGCLKREEASCGASGVCPVLVCCWNYGWGTKGTDGSRGVL